MTDKEIAVNWVTANTGFNPKEPLGKIAVRIFLAGLKAGRPEWHDLQKDPNDLPKVNTKVLLQIKDEDEPIKDFYRRDSVWNFANKYETIAWCEIPTFYEE